jgi:GTP 3',8-cyclase
LDLCGRSISYLRISVTDRCNYRCCYCMPPEGVSKQEHSEICSFEELCAMAEAAVKCGVTKLRVTGGEPLVRRGIVSFCKMLKNIPGVKELCLTTNGSLLPLLAFDLKAAGVDRLNISLDTLSPERFSQITRLGTLSDVLSGIKAAEVAGFENLKINCVLLGGINDDEISDFVELTKDKPYEVRFIERMPIGLCASFGSFVPASRVLEVCPALEPMSSEGVAKRYKINGYKGSVGLITPLSNEFCPQCNRLRITADGKLKPCLHSDMEIPLRGLTGQALEDAICRGILAKPEHHHLKEEGFTQSHRAMNQIGG